ncbi:MAG: hypothetical protein GXO97_03345 [Nitrospirae bacterium]|nr:hypothetical protein [Nitrospirota bacterium]
MNKAIWIFLFAIGIILFNWPFISIFTETQIYYLFVVWFLFILSLFLITYYIKKEDRGG